MTPSRRLALSAAAVVAATMFLAELYVARAKSGGESRRSLSFAGRLAGTTGPQSLKFTFKKAGATQCEPVVTTTPDATGAFNIEIPMAGCPSALFDGGDVTFDVTVGSTVVAHDHPVNPVPYARYADQVGSPDCPVGYSRDASLTSFISCARAGDEVVKVGVAQSAFWIDRYEASVWSAADGTGTQFGAATPDYPGSFPANGQYSTPLFALSAAAVLPSRGLSWFQANEACAASGKRLPTSSEWLRAARGTPDPPVDSDGTGGACVTKAAGPRKTGAGTACESAWGAQDLVGNSWEWVDEWHAGIGNADTSALGWPSGFGGDATYNIVSKAQTSSGPLLGTPAALLRGGAYTDGPLAGLNAMHLSYSPAYSSATFGFRCVIPR